MNYVWSHIPNCRNRSKSQVINKKSGLRPEGVELHWIQGGALLLLLVEESKYLGKRNESGFEWFCLLPESVGKLLFM